MKHKDRSNKRLDNLRSQQSADYLDLSYPEASYSPELPGQATTHFPIAQPDAACGGTGQVFAEAVPVVTLTIVEAASIIECPGAEPSYRYDLPAAGIRDGWAIDALWQQCSDSAQCEYEDLRVELIAPDDIAEVLAISAAQECIELITPNNTPGRRKSKRPAPVNSARPQEPAAPPAAPSTSFAAGASHFAETPRSSEPETAVDLPLTAHRLKEEILALGQANSQLTVNDELQPEPHQEQPASSPRRNLRSRRSSRENSQTRRQRKRSNGAPQRSQLLGYATIAAIAVVVLVVSVWFFKIPGQQSAQVAAQHMAASSAATTTAPSSTPSPSALVPGVPQPTNLAENQDTLPAPDANTALEYATFQQSGLQVRLPKNFVLYGNAQDSAVLIAQDESDDFRIHFAKDPLHHQDSAEVTQVLEAKIAAAEFLTMTTPISNRSGLHYIETAADGSSTLWLAFSEAGYLYSIGCQSKVPMNTQQLEICQVAQETSAFS